jgi:tetratricopeptide (TPR) repeat protein
MRGLDGEERWEFCNAIVKDFGLTVDRSQADWKTLIDELQGHPLMMRVVLSKLSTTTPGQLKTMLAGNLQDFLGLDTDSARMFATLKFVQDGLPADLRPWLTPLSLHERFVDADYLKEMGNRLAQPMSAGNSAVDRLMSQLTRAGLVTSIGQGLFELHPVLSRFLQQSTAAAEATESVTAWQRAFVEFMAGLADHFAPKELHEQRGVFHAFGSSFRRALSLAVDLGMGQAVAALTQSLAAFSMNTRRFQEASELFRNLAENRREAGDPEVEAAAYHQLGIIAQGQRDFATAEQWYRKSLAIVEKQGNEHGAASTYHHLGIIAREQRDFATAEQWYRKSLAIKEKQGNEHGAASTYHHLGIIAAEQQDFVTAEQWYRKSLAIFERLGSEHEAASTYHHLGIISAEQRDFATAEQWYRKSLAIFERQGAEHEAAGTYLQLGRIAAEQQDFATAELHFGYALSLAERTRRNDVAASSALSSAAILLASGRHIDAARLCISGLLAARRGFGAAIPAGVRLFTEIWDVVPTTARSELGEMWRSAAMGALPGSLLEDHS